MNTPTRTTTTTTTEAGPTPRYNVFHRTWWKSNKSWPGGREPHLGRKTYLRRGLTLSEARQACKDYNDTHNPGRLARKAEFEQA
jgi:hypothetical protein